SAMISPSACLPRSATDLLGPLMSARPAVSYTTRWGTIRSELILPARGRSRLLTGFDFSSRVFSQDG
ncbi:hypothetical protein, partial [Amaricoccus sp. W119]|uniref:hypothetical protein n=1 Tax=Amaricoccus sp. W119 TaxID=3391833 RepID=UPI0039A6525A